MTIGLPQGSLACIREPLDGDPRQPQFSDHCGDCATRNRSAAGIWEFRRLSPKYLMRETL
jgi:hypothetical protein